MTLISPMMSKFHIGFSAMGKPMGEDRQQKEVLLGGILDASPRSGTHHFHPLSIARAQSQDSSKCKGGWEILSFTHEPRSKRNGIIFAIGPYPCWSIGELSEEQCWVLGRNSKDVFYYETTVWLIW